jgi:signal transduction histidine kinase
LQRVETISALGLLLAGVAHEVRNPLYSISVNLDAFEAELGPRSEFTEFVTILRAEVDRLATLMRDLLEYGRPAERNAVSGTIDGVLAEAVARCSELAQRSDVAIVSDVGLGDTSLLMDRKRLAQVFQNLLQNAIQHSPPGGTVTITAGRRDAPGGAVIALEIMDSGPGFERDALRDVFKPFFTKRQGGTGLGLAIAQRIVEEHGGTISADNRPDPPGGGVILVCLPLETGSGEPIPSPIDRDDAEQSA